MKRITFTHRSQVEPLHIRNSKEQLIADIVEATSEVNKKTLARRIALVANQLKWGEAELHALLAKKNDPTIRNYTAFVKWSLKIKNI